MAANECLFCCFEQRFVIAETPLSFVTYFPRAIKRGHLVVATKAHVATFCDLGDEQVRDMVSLGLRVAKESQEMIGAQKYYLAAIGDVDLHFHIHMLPKLESDLPMGAHIMLDRGWKGEVGEVVSEAEVIAFIGRLRERCA